MSSNPLDTHSVYTIVIKFLCTVGLVSHIDSNAAISNESVKCIIDGVGNIHILLIPNIVSLTSMIDRNSSEILLVVTQNYKHAMELLEYNGTDSMNLMRRNILLVHIQGMMCTLSSRTRTYMTYFTSTGNIVTDRRLIINKCCNSDTSYESMPHLGDYGEYICSHNNIPDGTTCVMKVTMSDNKAKCIYYHRMIEPLETLGVDYIFSIFRISRLLRVDPDKLVYVFVSTSAVSALSFVE
jgi:hypothetical protein